MPTRVITLCCLWVLTVFIGAADCGPPVDTGSTGPAPADPPPLSLSRLVAELEYRGFTLGQAVPGAWDTTTGPARRLVPDEVGVVTVTSGPCKGATIDVFSSSRATTRYDQLLRHQSGRLYPMTRNTITLGSCGRLSRVLSVM